jgi:hypothetical protein
MFFLYTSFPAGNELILKLTKNTASEHHLLKLLLEPWTCCLLRKYAQFSRNIDNHGKKCCNDKSINKLSTLIFDWSLNITLTNSDNIIWWSRSTHSNNVKSDRIVCTVLLWANIKMSMSNFVYNILFLHLGRNSQNF